MGKNICNICGATYVLKHGKMVCPACGAYKPEEISNEEDTLLYNASQILRLSNFDEAAELFQDITVRFPQSSKGYWGLVLATYGIKYETDYDGKKIPTCFATSYESIYDDKNYLMALKLASKDDREYYQKQADIIENNRLEWINKAQKEKPYDIFICFKDTELSDGIQRTRDSYEAGELYNHLTKKGYNVFFSRESLSCYGEQYEPYIFNALNTAKVMIVYGTSAEYITSTWVKNEWTRFAKKIANKEKAPNSLVLCYHGFNPSTLPAPLKTTQSIDVDTITWMDRLDSFISSILANEAVSKPRLTKEVVKTQIGKKATTISSVSDRIIGAERKYDTKYTANEKINIVDKFLANGIYDSANDLIDSVLAETPNNGEAIFRKFMCINKIKDLDFISTFDARKILSPELIDNTLKLSDIEFANSVLKVLYDSIENTFKKYPNINDKNFLILTEIILSYNYEKRSERASALIDLAINTYNYDLFDLIAKATTVNDVDQYCLWLNKLLSHNIIDGRFDEAKRIGEKIFEVDEGNINARRAMIRIECRSQLEPSLVMYEGSIDKLKTYDCIKNLLQYETKEQQIEELKAIIKAIPYESMNLDFYTELLKYYPDNVSCFTDEMFNKGNYYLAHNQFDAAKYLFELLSSLNPKEATFYLYTIMAKCRVKNEHELVFAEDILTFDEYIPMLANADEGETVQFLNIVKAQRRYHDEQKEFETSNKDKIIKNYNQINKIKKEKSQCEKVFNRCNRLKMSDKKRTKFAFVFLFLFALFYLISYVTGILETFSPVGYYIVIIGTYVLAGLFVLLLIIQISHKLLSKKMFKRYGLLKKEEISLNNEARNYRQKYEFYDRLVEEFSKK